MTTFRDDLIKLAHNNPGPVRNALLPILAAADRGPAVTIYANAPLGLAKVEGYLHEVTDHGVEYIPKGGRKPRSFWTYYSPFIMVVEGFNKPDPDAAFGPAEPGSTPGVSIQKGRYRSTDPRWISDFLGGPGKSLRPIVLFQDGKLKFNRSMMASAGTSKRAIQIPNEGKDNSWGRGYYPLPPLLHQLGMKVEALKFPIDHKVWPEEGIHMLTIRVTPKLSIMKVDLLQLLKRYGLSRIQSNDLGKISFYFQSPKWATAPEEDLPEDLD